MQISRHWRMQQVRYQLKGVRYTNLATGEVSLQLSGRAPAFVVDPKNQRDNADKEPVRQMVA